MLQPPFPKPRRYNDRKFYSQAEVDHFKAQLQAQALGLSSPVEPAARVGPDTLVPHKVVAAQFGISTRTLDRWVEATAKAETAEVGEAA